MMKRFLRTIGHLNHYFGQNIRHGIELYLGIIERHLQQHEIEKCHFMEKCYDSGLILIVTNSFLVTNIVYVDNSSFNFLSELEDLALRSHK